MDWTKCPICGKAGNEDLRCPLDSLQGNGEEVYGKFLKAVQGFQEINAMPVKLEVTTDKLTVESFLENQAKWHKSCYLKFNLTKLQRAEKSSKGKKRCLDPPVEERKSECHSSSTSLQVACIFCNDESGQLYNCSTMGLDQELRQMATGLQDTSLLSRISGGDLIAIEAKYHINCLVAYKNRHRSAQRACASESSGTTEENILQARAFAELISYIEGIVENGTYIFKLAELHDLYENRLREFGMTKSIN